MTVFNYNNFLKSCSLESGVYEMFDSSQNILYVGKAKNLKNRIASYFNKNLSKKTQALVAKIADIRITITSTEKEALILEANLIKQYKPKYNILLRDDKSYPYIILDNKNFPRLDFYRGLKVTKKKNNNYEFFGPYPNAGYARQTLNLLQKIFLLRNCSDSFFSNRSRPCMQYQINRCSAPCVGYIDEISYKKQVLNAKLFLMGKNQDVIKNLVQQMNVAADNLDYERAAKVRDSIKTLQEAQQQQFIISSNDENIDLIIILNLINKYCISLNKVRNGVFISTQQFFMSSNLDIENQDNDFGLVLYNFLSQYYLSSKNNLDLPDKILLNESLNDKNLFIDILSSNFKKIKIVDALSKNKRQYNKYKEWVDIAVRNLKHAVYNKSDLLEQSFDFKNNFNVLKEFFKLNSLNLIECFDVSHTSGFYTVASQVAFNNKGPDKKLYKKYNILLSKQSDDYGAMREVISRRFRHKLASNMPEVLLIDGGIGQLNVVYDELVKLFINNKVVLLGICKGDLRKSSNDKILYFNSNNKKIETLNLEENTKRMLQMLRDEAHRFAIKAMQAKRSKKGINSILEEIPGLGKKRIQKILEHFGGWVEVKRSTKEQLQQIPGISDKLSSIILDKLKNLKY